MTGPTEKSDLSPAEFATVSAESSPKAMERLLKAEQGERADLRRKREESGPVRIWLDDEREAPSGWLRVTSAWAAIEWLDCGVVVGLSLDHDLGDDDRLGTGLDVIRWLAERQEVDGRPLWPSEGVTVHTMNAVGREAMTKAIRADAGRRFYVAEYRSPQGQSRFRMLPHDAAPKPNN